MAKFDKSNLCLKFPDAFEFLQGKDVKYEMVATNLLQPMALFNTENIVHLKIAVIFLTTECNGLKPHWMNYSAGSDWKYNAEKKFERDDS